MLTPYTLHQLEGAGSGYYFNSLHVGGKITGGKATSFPVG